MEYRQLGRTGIRVSELCRGAMTHGRGQAPPPDHRRALSIASAERLGYPYEFVMFAND